MPSLAPRPVHGQRTGSVSALREPPRRAVEDLDLAAIVVQLRGLRTASQQRRYRGAPPPLPSRGSSSTWSALWCPAQRSSEGSPPTMAHRSAATCGSPATCRSEATSPRRKHATIIRRWRRNFTHDLAIFASIPVESGASRHCAPRSPARGDREFRPRYDFPRARWRGRTAIKGSRTERRRPTKTMNAVQHQS